MPSCVRASPDIDHVSTSHVERQNLTVRMSIRRFTWLTNAFSKKFDSQVNAISLYFVFYNWMRLHKSLQVTPAMEAGLTDKLMTFEDLLVLMDAVAPKTGRPRKNQEIKSASENT